MNNTVWEDTFTIAHCYPNQTEVVILIYFGKKTPNHELRRSLLPFIKQNNNKILLFALQYGDFDQPNYIKTFLLSKRMLQKNQKVKIIFFSHFYDFENCLGLMLILNRMQLIQLPFNSDNLGLILLENGEPDKWDVGEERLDIEMVPESKFLYVLHGMAWDHCVDFCYRLFKCEKYGCPLYKILINKDNANRFTKILLVKMTTAGQLIKGRETLETFINERLQFTPLSINDIQIFQPSTFEKLRDYHQMEQDTFLEMGRELFFTNLAKISEIENGTFFLNSFDFKYLFYKYHPRITKTKLKRHIAEDLVDAGGLYIKMMKFVPPLSRRLDSFSVRIRDAMLKYLGFMTAKDDKEQIKIYCNHFRKSDIFLHERIALERAQNYFQHQMDILGPFAETLHQVFLDLDYVKTAEYYRIEAHDRIMTHLRKLTRFALEKVFQMLLAEFTIDWNVQTEPIETAVVRGLRKLIHWAHKIPAKKNEFINWRDFSNWIGTDVIHLSGINVNETSDLFEFIQKSDVPIHVQKSHWMIWKLIYAFNMNVTTVAIQRLATSKLPHIDAVVALLDSNFMSGIRKLHQSIDSEQWITIRPHIFYYLIKLQQEATIFDNFLIVVKRMFDIHHIDMPMTSYARLRDLKAEFDYHQYQMARYINGSINTTQQWGRKFHKTTDYIFKNSGSQHKSCINDVVKWIKEELVFEPKPTWSGYDFQGTLILVNLVVQKLLKGC